MTNLMRNDNFYTDLFEFRRDFDQIFNQMLTFKPFVRGQLPLETAFNLVPFVPAVEAYVDTEARKYICRVSLPGIEPKEIEINLQGNLLTIKGEKKTAKTLKEAEVKHSEFLYGSFERTLTLPEGIAADKLVAEFHNGVLEITAPVAVAALPRKIEVKEMKTAPTAKYVTA
ncbi:MAG: Hsp20/alpha crystallin family protein [Candidatus Acidiferrales bacterium]